YSLTDQLLTSGTIDVGQLAIDTGLSGITAGAGSALLQNQVRRLSNTLKGEIGELTSIAYNWIKGSEYLGRQQAISGYTTIADSVWRSRAGSIYYVESKFGYSTLTNPQRFAQQGLGTQYVVERWGYDWVGGMGARAGAFLGLGVSATS